MKKIIQIFKSWSPLFVLILFFLLIRTYVTEASFIPSTSMEPTLQVHDVIQINKMVNPQNLQFGDVVTFYSPIESERNKKLIKRIIGTSGDVIEIREGSLFRNGVKMNEPYIKEPMTYDFGPIKVPPGKFFVLGDNRNYSIDSHVWTNPFVDQNMIVGKAVFRLYPFTNINRI
ncbi:signal peptidase I [Effusibacillus consociatus]|uniref:Signal peptidase I n=1 Tax=Effusibacillus consociatus TaxID=1117041 RepID=A0ABV9PVS5_9BACL